MPIEPFIKCSNLKTSLAFYTAVLDFTVIVAPDPNPEAFMSRYSLIGREGGLVHLSSHSNDGAFGSLNYVRVDDVDTLYQKFVKRGLVTNTVEGYPCVVIHPVEQTWGMKEFSVMDPDGNKLTFGHEVT